MGVLRYLDLDGLHFRVRGLAVVGDAPAASEMPVNIGSLSTHPGKTEALNLSASLLFLSSAPRSRIRRRDLLCPSRSRCSASARFRRR
jgi:hypothetical protein